MGLGGEDTQGTYKFGKVPARAELVQAEEYDGVFPDVNTVMPTSVPDATFYVNAQMLIEALEGMRNGYAKRVKVTVRNGWDQGIGSMIEVFGYNDPDNDETPLYAVIMQMKPAENDRLTWRPGKAQPDENKVQS